MTRLRTDLLIAGLLAVLAQAELWSGDQADKPFFAFVAILLTAPLALRRTRPLAALGVVLFGLALLSVKESDYFPTAAFVGLLLAAYSVGAYAEARSALAGILAACAVALVNTVAVGADEGGDYVFPVLLLTGSWLAGRALTAWRARAEELERLNQKLAEQQEQLARLAIAEERARIARELHDVVAHSVNVAIIHAEAAEEVLSQSPEDAREALRRIQASGREALTEMRRLLGMLRDDEGDDLGMPARLDDLETLAQNLRAAGLEVELRIRGDRRPLAPGVELSAYRVVQEALTNTLKHASATTAAVTVSYGDSDIVVDVIDDGSQAPSENDGGQGLVGMRERVALVGGKLDTGRRREGGFFVHASLPLEQ